MTQHKCLMRTRIIWHSAVDLSRPTFNSESLPELPIFLPSASSALNYFIPANDMDCAPLSPFWIALVWRHSATLKPYREPGSDLPTLRFCSCKVAINRYRADAIVFIRLCRDWTVRHAPPTFSHCVWRRGGLMTARRRYNTDRP
ncbi:hypothetical protein BKA93DRAFT_201564 [Sparassis latifolia]